MSINDKLDEEIEKKAIEKAVAPLVSVCEEIAQVMVLASTPGFLWRRMHEIGPKLEAALAPHLAPHFEKEETTGSRYVTPDEHAQLAHEHLQGLMEEHFTYASTHKGYTTVYASQLDKLLLKLEQAHKDFEVERGLVEQFDREAEQWKDATALALRKVAERDEELDRYRREMETNGNIYSEQVAQFVAVEKRLRNELLTEQTIRNEMDEHMRLAGIRHDEEIEKYKQALERMWAHEEKHHPYCSACSPQLERQALNIDK